MLGLFSNVPKVFNVAKNLSKIDIDNAALKLQYKVTTTVLVTATLIVCAQNYIGQPIDCVQSSGAIPQNVLNTYCFFIGTYSVISNDTEYPFHGIGPDEQYKTTRHLWYQWVPFYLTFLAITYYSPHFIWKSLEKGRLKSILFGMEYMKYAICDTKIGNIPSCKEKEQQLNLLAHHMYDRIKYKLNRSWAFHLFLVEIYAMIQAGFAYWLTDLFVGGGGAFVNLSLQTGPEVFPTMTKCRFHKFGPSGGIQKHDALCVLALNIVNEKLFYFLHFLFPFVLGAAVLAVLWRILCIFLYSNLKFNQFMYRECNSVQIHDRQRVLSTISYWDWVFLSYLASNSSGLVFQDLYEAISQCIEDDEGTDDDNSSALLKNESKEYGKHL